MTIDDNSTDYSSIKAVNISKLIHMLDGPKAYAHAATVGFPDTAAMSQGRALHCLILESSQFDRRYVVTPYPDMRSDAAKFWPDLFRLAVFEPANLEALYTVSPYEDYRTKAARAWKAEQALAGRTIVKAEEMDAAIQMAKIYSPDMLDHDFEVVTQSQVAKLRLAAEEVLSNKQAMRLLDGGAAEECWTWTDPATGILCKGRTDYLGIMGLVDLKSAASAHPRRFAAQASRLGYPIKMGWYQWAVEMVRGALPPVFMIAVQLEPYTDVACYSLAQQDLNEGRKVAQQLLKQLADCLESGQWPSITGDSIQELAVSWAKSNEDTV